MADYLVIATVPFKLQLPDVLPEGQTAESVMPDLLNQLGYEGAVIVSIEEIPPLKH